ncbi:LOW QUALITY PROTEIN: DDB1- and CUL4-associated factor 16 [Ctenodactylus gundi]
MGPPAFPGLTEPGSNEESSSPGDFFESHSPRWNYFEEGDLMVSNLTPLESLAWQVRCLFKHSTTKPLNPNSWLYHAKLLDPSTPAHILQETGLRLCRSHYVPKLQPIPEWPPLASCGVSPFQKPLFKTPSSSTELKSLSRALQFATKQLSRALSRASPIYHLKHSPKSSDFDCCCDGLSKTVETTHTELLNTTCSYTDLQKSVSKLLTASL